MAVANGDVPLVDGAVQAPAQAVPAAGGATAKVGGVMSISGKKQATVRAVPRVDQPATTAQEKVSNLEMFFLCLRTASISLPLLLKCNTS